MPGLSLHTYRILPYILALLSSAFASQARPVDSGWDKLTEEEMITRAMHITSVTLWEVDSVSVIRRLEGLARAGRKSGNTGMEAIAYSLQADYLYYTAPKSRHEAEKLYLRALETAKAKRLRKLSLYFEYALGQAYYFGTDRIKGIEYLFSAREHLQDIGYPEFPATGPLLYVLGTIYCDYNEFSEGREYLTQAVRYPFADSKMRYRLYGMLGLAYYRLQSGDSSIYYSRRALTLAQQMKDTAEIGSMSGNIGAGYLIKKNYDTAISYLSTDYVISRRLENWGSASASLITIAKIYISKKEYERALELLTQADSIFSFCECRTDNAMWDIYHSLSEIYKNKKDYYLLSVYLDSFNRYNDIHIRNHNTSVLKGIELKVAAEMHETRMKLMESERKRQLLLRNALITATILTIIIIIQVLYRMRQRQVSERKIFTLQLSSAQKQLCSYLDSLREKNRLMDQLREELEHARFVHPENSFDNSAEREKILARIRDANLITEEGWQEFTGLVDAVHKNFFIRLKERFPDLTPADTRLLTLVKLNFSTGEMADMLGISPDSVKKARQRVRKKIGIPSEEDISNVVAQL